MDDDKVYPMSASGAPLAASASASAASHSDAHSDEAASASSAASHSDEAASASASAASHSDEAASASASAASAESTPSTAAPSERRRLRVLVAGSTGYLGKAIVFSLHARGHRVRALVRGDKSKLGAARDACEDVFVGEATDDSTLNGVMDGMDAVVSCLGNRTFKSRPTVWAVDRDANLNLAKRAAKAGVGRFVFVSVFEGHKVRSKIPQIEAREQVVDTLARGQMPWTIIRPSGFFNDMTEIFDMAAKGTVWLIGNGMGKFNPIHGADLADFTVQKLEDEEAVGKHFPVGGPELLTQRQVGELAFTALNSQPKIKTTPKWLVPLAAKVVMPFNKNLGSFLAMLGLLGSGADNVAPQTGVHRLGDFFKEYLSNNESLKANR